MMTMETSRRVQLPIENGRKGELSRRGRLRIVTRLLSVLALSTSLAAMQSPPFVNLALGKPAKQISDDLGNTADRAVDGNSGTFAQTQAVMNPWWQVDLGEIAYIDSIQIDRTDVSVTKGIYVFISESNDMSDPGNQADIVRIDGSLLSGIAGTKVDLQRTGRYIRIQVSTNVVMKLNLVEVQVLGIQIPANPALAGQWASITPPLHTADSLSVGNTWNTLSIVHVSLLPNGKLLFWGRDKRDDTNPADENYANDADGHSNAYIWDMSKNDDLSTLQDERLTPVPNNTTNLFCAGHSFLPNGNLFVAGGAEAAVDNSGAKHYDMDGNGVRQTYIFDWHDDKVNAGMAWSSGPDMRQPRWYPSLLTLSNGETLIINGDFMTFTQSNIKVPNHNKDTEILGLDMKLRIVPGDAPDLPNYPFAHLGPDGNALIVSGSDQTGHFYYPSPGSWLPQDNLKLKESHDVGTSVMYDRGKIMAIGGRFGLTGVTRDTETIDLNLPSPLWTTVTPMHFERYYTTSVLMPDGEIFVVGGSKCGGANNIQSSPPDNTCKSGAVMYPEIYDPASQTQAWSIMSRQTTIRMYHSVALLLPDATIMVAGGGRPGAFGESMKNGMPSSDKYLAHHEVEIFSPPYLFNSEGTLATRPAITNNPPSSIIYGQSFNVGIGNLVATQIRAVVLVRLPSVTHALNFDQRRVVLTFHVLDQQSLSVTAPANGIEAPPGPYMLFVIGPNGVPSMAKMALVANDNPPVANFTISCAARFCTANASASSDDAGIVGYQWNWGDNQISSGGPTASHMFAVDGTYRVTLTVSDTIGQTDSKAKPVSVCDLAITTQPTSSPAAIPSGGSSTLTIAVTGTAPVNVQWYTSTGTAVGSGTSVSVSPTTNTVYYAVVTNLCGNVQSANVLVSVCSPGLGTAPTATPSTITAGQTSKLEMGNATGQGTLTYLWYKSDGTLVGTSTNKKLNVAPTISTSYYYKVSNSCGTTGPSATVTVTVQ
jgi:hypothetical protein